MLPYQRTIYARLNLTNLEYATLLQIYIYKLDRMTNTCGL